MNANEIQQVNAWVSEFTKLTKQVEKLHSGVEELHSEYESKDEDQDRAGLKSNKLDAKLQDALWNADYHLKELEDNLLKSIAYLNKFSRCATQSLMKSEAEPK